MICVLCGNAYHINFGKHVSYFPYTFLYLGLYRIMFCFGFLVNYFLIFSLLVDFSAKPMFSGVVSYIGVALEKTS